MNQGLPWTEEHYDVVRTLWSTMTGKQIGVILGRTDDSVKNAAKRLNLRKPSVWTDENLQFLRDNWKIMTATKIAETLGCTRNAVIGKAHRLGLDTKLPNEQRTSAQHSNNHIVKPPVVDDIAPLRVNFFDLKNHQCRWPYDEPNEVISISYCGNQTIDGQSYCAGHYHMAYRPVPPRRSHRGVPLFMPRIYG